MIQTILALALSAAAGYVLYRKRVPAGMLIGAVIASAVLTAVFHAGHIPSAAKNIAQVIAGTFIGCSAGPIPIWLSRHRSVGCSDHRCRTAGHRRCIWQMDGETVRRSRAGGNADADLCRGRGNGVDLHGHWHHLPRLILVQIYRLIIATAVFPQICLLVSGLFT